MAAVSVERPGAKASAQPGEATEGLDADDVLDSDCIATCLALADADTAKVQYPMRHIDGDGVDLIRDLRQWSAVPVIVLSARSREADKIAALDAGADDYLVKPFGSGELLARVRAQLRRHSQQGAQGEPVQRFGDITVDRVHRSVQRAGEALHLTPIEYRLLTHLLSQPDRVVTHAQLLQAVWGPGHREDTHYVRVHMANLRKKIEADSAQPRFILTEPGIEAHDDEEVRLYAAVDGADEGNPQIVRPAGRSRYSDTCPALF